MEVGGILGISIMVIFTALGTLHGTLRSFFAFIGIYVAFLFTKGMLPPVGTASSTMYVMAFVGIFAAVTVGGFLLYGATRLEPIEALEGVLGFILGMMTGWGFAKFVFSYFVAFSPQSQIAQQATMYGSIAWNIFTVAPYYDIMNIPLLQNLRKPKI